MLNLFFVVISEQWERDELLVCDSLIHARAAYLAAVNYLCIFGSAGQTVTLCTPRANRVFSVDTLLESNVLEQYCIYDMDMEYYKHDREEGEDALEEYKAIWLR